MSKIDLTSYDKATLETLAESVSAEVERRRDKPTMDDIKPGMSPEMQKRILAEIVRATGGRN